MKEILGRVEVKLEDRDQASQFRLELREVSLLSNDISTYKFTQEAREVLQCTFDAITHEQDRLQSFFV